MEEVVSDNKGDNNEINDEEKEADCPYDTPPIDKEESVKYINIDRNKKYDEEKRGRMHI